MVFVFAILSELNSDPNNLAEMLVMLLSKYYIDSFKISKSSLSGPILIN